MELNDIFVVYLLCVFIVIVIGCAFIIWIIKKGVKNAIEETLYSDEFREQLRNDITYSIISAKRQYENNERPSE